MVVWSSHLSSSSQSPEEDEFVGLDGSLEYSLGLDGSIESQLLRWEESAVEFPPYKLEKDTLAGRADFPFEHWLLR